MENSGVTFGVHDFRQQGRTREEYHGLLSSQAGDTRNRIFNVDSGASTFNMNSRARSLGLPGAHPKGEYSRTRSFASSSLPTETAWPKSCAGGFCFEWQGSYDDAERHRRAEGLGRNIVGHVTIKDGRVYQGTRASFSRLAWKESGPGARAPAQPKKA
mmetsp:Transcript_77970/g.203178  ORF Transcript_77970/g.203178 Transcript_77970/m.203178 type:complete len:158 (+) Transcript_77970:100-573(+)